MSENKRFKLVWYDTGERFIDNETGLGWLSSPYGRFHTLDKLNELADENEQLKNRILDLEELNRIYVDFLVSKGFELSDVMKSDSESTIKEATLPASAELTREKYLYG